MARILSVVTFTSLALVCEGKAFRRATYVADGGVDTDNLEQTLLAEIEGQVGSGSIRSRMVRLEATLKPMFESLPKNEHKRLGHSTVRYALHRLFVQKHGWYIKGLDSAGGSWHEQSHAHILKEQAADFVQSVFEHRLGDRGLGLRELAVVAATLEHLIHDEAEERLAKAYSLLLRDENSTMTVDQASDVLNTYLKLFIVGDEVGASITEGRMAEIYPGWSDTKAFAGKILKETADQSSNVDFTMINRAVEEVGEQFGGFQNGECLAIKNDLIALGDKGIGRVPLSDFYKPALDGTSWQFTESVDYLRSLGALDESNPSMPSVIVPNYVNSQSNCVVSTSYYSVCCIDECEGLMGRLEKEFQKPEASPQEISNFVADLSTSTVSAPRSLSAPLLQKLDQIAEGNDGSVPLHGRMFAQWMHHAFPRECPYPHVAGSITPQTPQSADEWVSRSAMQEYATAKNDAESEESYDEVSLWTHEEELLVPRPSKAANTDGTRSILRPIVMVAALAAVGFRALSTTGKATSALLPFHDDGKAGKLI
jgi:hypothetical protein